MRMYGSYLYLFCQFFDQKYTFRSKIQWPMCIYLGIVHLLALLGLTRCNSISRVLDVTVLYLICGLGVTAGMHRLWSHRSYRATTPVRLFLGILASMSNQGSIFHWCRDHRLHHKKSDTALDPHDSARGFFYSHIGWLRPL